MDDLSLRQLLATLDERITHLHHQISDAGRLIEKLERRRDAIRCSWSVSREGTGDSANLQPHHTRRDSESVKSR